MNMSPELRRYGAAISTAVALGGLSLASAEARPAIAAANHPANISKGNLPPTTPKGAYTTDHLSLPEVRKAVANLHKRWEGVLVLHAPKKNAYVGFTQSPSYYVSENDGLMMLGNKTRVQAICSRPGIEKIHGRDYAVVYDMETAKWAFLDIKFAEETGALSSYAFKGKKAHIEDYPFEQQQIDGPVINDVIDYGADWTYGEDNRAKQLLGIYLPTNIDPHRKYYHLTPTDAVPHL
jgi:hypothetical protein